jgi:hypothetical protein
MKNSWKFVMVGVAFLAICVAAAVWQVSRMRSSQALAREADTYRANAQRGDAAAEEKLGTMYYHGSGVPQDYGEALRLFNLSAGKGNAQALYDVGMMYESGLGVQQDYPEALRWYRKAAELKNADAECSIGSMYYYGRGADQDFSLAMSWLRLAAGQGLARAEFDLGVLYDRGRGVPRDPAEASYWYRKAANQGYESAERALGLKSNITSIWSLTAIAMFFACLWILKDAESSRLGWRIWNLPQHDLAALLGLAYSGMVISRLAVSFHSALGVNLYIFFECLFLGMCIAVSFYAFWRAPRRAKLTLSVIAALLVGINAFVAAHRGRVGPSSPAIHALSSLDGLFVGIALSIVASLWLMRNGLTPTADGRGLGTEVN